MQFTDRTRFEYPLFESFETDEIDLGEIGIYGEQTLYGESEMDEIEEMQWATELLAVTSDEELDQFLGKFFKRVGKSLGPALKGVAKTVAPVLKTVAKTAIPIAGRALGTAFGGPIGGMIGGKLGDAATKIFGLEIEGMSGEDQSFEVARRVVRFGADAVRRAGATAATGAVTPQAMSHAVRAAAKTHAPGLLRPAVMPGRPVGTTIGTAASLAPTGRWIRRGHAIVVLGA